ncbi:hypothetical protein BpJC7_31430 [Weizmannia acidilactici]|uniref:Uncharacterized protein n=1 Tax=Weizmannia acidilactici TaxID=2607726 RepID=A0A5J4JMG0_9BACI|nr:hypothetical protein BpJC4_30230 [Weizmannia acidilactici]GER71840.1 hypothetical protein BpJC7_31430 [Weizmannia acidilactici]GER75043.1 hypothetical protein BpPP18_31100 [Weizmannia acidilactici]
MYNKDKNNTVVFETTLDKLKADPNVVDNNFWDKIFGTGERGLKAGTSDQFQVKFKFKDNGENQNDFQRDSIQLKWTFHASQTLGEEK